MAIDMGEIIHELVKNKGYKAKFVADSVNTSESTIYKIYHRKVIDIPRLIAFSTLLDKNLFEYYMDEETFSSLFNSGLQRLKDEILSLKNSNRQKEKRIKELEANNSTLKKLIRVMEKKPPQ